MEIDKKRWTELDFSELGWHDCRLYGLVNNYSNFQLRLDIDYILKWEKDDDEFKGFWISPCDIIFENYSYLDIRILNNGTTDTIISNISMNLQGATPNKEHNIYEFKVELNNENYILINATGFKQELREDPIFSSSQDFENIEKRK